jgi:hypothetical protein
MDMKMGRAIVAGVIAAGMLWSGAAMGQAKPGCDPKVHAGSPEKVAGQVVKVDQAEGKVTIKEADGKTYEFHADKDTLQNLKIGDRLEAKLRPPPTC